MDPNNKIRKQTNQANELAMMRSRLRMLNLYMRWLQAKDESIVIVESSTIRVNEKQ